MEKQKEVMEKARASAWEAYKKAIAPVDEAYEKAKKTAWEAYEKARAPADEAYEKARAPVWEAYKKAKTSALKSYIEPKKLVPVNLKSESVTLEWLVNYSNKKIEREEKEGDDLIGEAIIEHYKELISAAKKQAVEEK